MSLYKEKEMTHPTLQKGYDQRGASMGRPNTLPEIPTQYPVKLHMYALRWVDGDYDEGGAYWGHVHGDHIYRAYGETSHLENVEVFVRAKSRDEAKEQIARLLAPTPVKFYR